MNDAPDLYALVIRLVARGGGSLRATQGHLAHAAFFDLLRGVDPPLAAALHDDRGRKPFTLSPLQGLGPVRDGRLAVRPGDAAWLRVTLLDPLLFQTFIRFFLAPGRPASLRLEPIEWQVTELLSTPTSHPLAGLVALDELWRRWAEGDPAPDWRRIDLVFRSPTAFSLRRDPEERAESPGGRSPRRMHVLPDPSLVFGELAGHWDRLTGDDSQAAVRHYAARDVVVARHAIETHMYQFPRGKQVGFTGRVLFELLGDDELLIRHLNRLADLAFFTGLGSKTTMGMGQVNRHG
jgi:CRISPR-associated endoribonuclease Cas6